MIIGNKLEKLLEKNKSNIIASKLLSLQTSEATWEFEIDYIDIAISNNNKISYITKDRIDRFFEKFNITSDKLLPRNFNRVELDPSSEFTDQQTGFGTVVEVHYEDLEFCNIKFNYTIQWEDGTIFGYRPIDIKDHDILVESIRSYANDTTGEKVSGRYMFNDLEYRTKYAYMTSPGKFIQKLNLGFSDKEVQEFFSIFMRDDVALTTEGVRFELVNGNSITKYYLADNYAGESGNLGGSCMRYSNTQNFVKLYAKFPDKIRMLTLLTVEDGLVAGRAIVWKCYNAEDDSEIIFMDRIYTNNSNHEEFFKYYARKNKWWYKEYQSYSELDSFRIPDNEYSEMVTSNIYIELEDINGDLFPYLDTFASGNLDSRDVLTLYNDSDHDDNFHNVEGGPYSEQYPTVWSEYLEEDIPEGEACYSEYLESYIYMDDAVEVIVKENGCTSYMPIDHDDIVEVRRGPWYLKEICIYSTFYDEYIYGEDVVSINSGEDYVFMEDASYCKYKEDYYFSQDCIFSEYENDFLLIEDAVEDEIEGWVLKSSLDDILEARKEEEYEATN